MTSQGLARGRSLACAALLVLLAPPSGSSQDRKVVRVTAERFTFTPSHIKVKRGDVVELRLRSDDTNHGFRILGSRAKPAVPQLIGMLGTDDDLIRSRVASSLEAIGPSAFPELLEAFRTSNGQVSSGAATVLYSIDLERAVKAGVK